MVFIIIIAVYWIKFGKIISKQIHLVQNTINTLKEDIIVELELFLTINISTLQFLDIYI